MSSVLDQRFRVYPKTDQHQVDAGLAHPPTMGFHQAIDAAIFASGRDEASVARFVREIPRRPSKRIYIQGRGSGISVLVDHAPVESMAVAA